MNWEPAKCENNSYRNIHNAGESEDKNQLKESEEVSLGGEGGEEEADEGDAGDVGDGQGEKAEKQYHCSSHYPICSILILVSGL